MSEIRLSAEARSAFRQLGAPHYPDRPTFALAGVDSDGMALLRVIVDPDVPMIHVPQSWIVSLPAEPTKEGAVVRVHRSYSQRSLIAERLPEAINGHGRWRCVDGSEISWGHLSAEAIRIDVLDEGEQPVPDPQQSGPPAPTKPTTEGKSYQ